MATTESADDGGFTPPPDGSQARLAYNAMQEVEPGDEILYGERAQPVTVDEIEVDDGNRILHATGPRGGSVEIIERYTPQGQLAYSDRPQGMTANNLTIVGGAGRTVESEEPPEPAGRGGGDGDSDEDTPAGGVPEPDQKTPQDKSPETVERELDADDFVYETTGDPSASFNDLRPNLLDVGSRDEPLGLEDVLASAGENYAGYTFIDELLSIGLTMPRTVWDGNGLNWHLADPGFVDNGYRRLAVWVNPAEGSVAALGAVNHPFDDNEFYWYVFHDEVRVGDGKLEPELITEDPYEAVDHLVEILYGDLDTVDIEVVEDESGNIRIRDNVRSESIAERVFASSRVPVPESAAAVGRRAEYIIGGVAQNVTDFFAENQRQFGELFKFGVVYTVLAGMKSLTNWEFYPVVEDEAFGIRAAYHYEGRDFRDIPLMPGPLANFINEAVIDDGEGPAFQADTGEQGFVFTVNPQRIDVPSAGPVTWEYLSYDRLQTFVNTFNLEEVDFRFPGSGVIDSMEIDADGTRVVKHNSETADKVSRAKNNVKSATTSRVAQAATETASTAPGDDVDHVDDDGYPSEEHIFTLRQSLAAESTLRGYVEVTNEYAARFIRQRLLENLDEGEDLEDNVERNQVGSLLGNFYRAANQVSTIVERRLSDVGDATNTHVIADIIEEYEASGDWDTAVGRVIDNETMGRRFERVELADDDDDDENGGSVDHDENGDDDGTPSAAAEEMRETGEQAGREAVEDIAGTGDGGDPIGEDVREFETLIDLAVDDEWAELTEDEVDALVHALAGDPETDIDSDSGLRELKEYFATEVAKETGDEDIRTEAKRIREYDEDEKLDSEPTKDFLSSGAMPVAEQDAMVSGGEHSHTPGVPLDDEITELLDESDDVMYEQRDERSF